MFSFFWLPDYLASAGSEACVQINVLLKQLSPNVPSLSEEDLTALLARPNVHILFSCDRLDGRHCAVGMARLTAVPMLKGNEGYVADVVIRDDYRGRGLGKAIMEALHQRAREIGLLRIMLFTQPERVSANALYRSLEYDHLDICGYRKKL